MISERWHSELSMKVSSSRLCHSVWWMSLLFFSSTLTALYKNSWRSLLLSTWMTFFIYSESEKNHKKHVKQVLLCLWDSRLFIKLEKCIFHASQVKYLRYIIFSQGINMNSAWVNTVRDWLTLCSGRMYNSS